MLKEFELEGNIVCYDDYAFENKIELRNFIESKDLLNLSKKLVTKTVIVLGGDGTMLKAIKKYYSEDFAFFGINFGNKGFLLNSIDSILNLNSFVEKEYPLIDIKILTQNIAINTIAVNEVDIRADNGKMISLDIKIGDEDNINLEGDGLIIATPVGTTGYNSSLGGAILPHSNNSFVLTPKAAWKPKKMKSIIFDDGKIVSINTVGTRNNIKVYSDSEEIIKIDTEQKAEFVIRKHNSDICLLIADNYIDAWNLKVSEEITLNK